MKLIIKLFLILILANTTGLAAQASEVVIIVNGANHNTLSAENIRRIFIGRDERFPDGSAVAFIMRSDRWAHWETCTQRYSRMTPDALTRAWARRVFSGSGAMAAMAVTDADAIAAVSNNPGGITCISASSAEAAAGIRVIVP